MKKTKLLMPLAGVAALGAVTPVIMATTSCNKTATISDLVITLDATQVPNIYIGTTINKSNIKVDVKMSDGTTKENVTDWTCDKFNAEGNYMFTQVGDVEFAFIYEKFEKKQTFTAKSVADARFLSDTYTLNYDNTNTISTSAKLSIVSKGTVMVLDANLFDWEEVPLSQGADKILDISATTGVITAVKTGSTTVSAKFKDDTQSAAFTCTVNVVASNITFDDTNDILTIDDGLVSTNGLLTVPRIVSIGTESNEIKKRTVKYIKAADTAATTVKTLILPATLNGIGEGTFANCKLQNIYYNGTQADWMESVYPETGDNWAGNLAVGVECTDGMLLFNNRYDTKVYDEDPAETVGNYLALENTIGALIPRTYTIRFDYSKLGLANDYDAKKITIQAFKENLFGEYFTGITINHLYVDGVEETVGTTGTNWIYSNGQLTAQTGTALTVTSNVVINLTTPGLQVVRHIHMSAAELQS